MRDDLGSYQPQPLLLLDTNAVHSVQLYLRFAERHNLPPIGDASDDPVEELKKEFGQRGQTFQSYNTGRKIANYLRDKNTSGTRIEYSPVTRLELTCGLLRGRAILEAAKEGPLLRMWNRMDEREIFHRLKTTDYIEVQKDMEGLEEFFGAGGINIAETDPGLMTDVWLLARLLLGVVFLDLGDSAVYASSLLVEANELITIDGYFRWIANQIENPGAVQDTEEKIYFQQAKEKLVEYVSRAIDISASGVHLPKAPDPSKLDRQ